jgi:hypothetical protein
LLTSNEPEFAALPPGQIVPVLADRGLHIGSERSFYPGCSTRIARHFDVVEHAHPRSPDQFHACGPQDRIRCGAGTSPISPPPCAAGGCTSTW